MTDGFDQSILLEEFREEARRQLDHLDRHLSELEEGAGSSTGGSAELLRALHTLKGNSAMIGLRPIADHVHALEGAFRAEGESLGRHGLDRLFEVSAAIRRVVERLGSPQQEAALERLESLDPYVAGSGERSPTVAEGADPAAADAEDRLMPGTEVLRVPFAKLDALLHEVGELVGVHAALQRLVEGNRDSFTSRLRREVEEQLEDLEMLASSLRETTMELRLVPLRQLFGPLPGLARDLAARAGKRVRVATKGEDIELDKSTVDALAEPLLHLVRNAVDHGIEPPVEREGRGKDPVGTISVLASRMGDQVRLEVLDDGAGLDHASILRRARTRGLVPEGVDPAADEVLDLIFAPGFSTRSEATLISGRGIGLDIVRRGVSRLRGSLDVGNQPDGGTRFALTLPLTLAIVPALVFESDGELLALAAGDIRETLSAARPEVAGEVDVVRTHDGLVPLAYPGRVFGWSAGRPNEPPRFAIVVGEGRRLAAVAADRLLEQRNVVIKPLPPLLGRARGISGATVAADGRVIPLLDAAGLVDLNLEHHRRERRGGQA